MLKPIWLDQIMLNSLSLNLKFKTIKRSPRDKSRLFRTLKRTIFNSRKKFNLTKWKSNKSNTSSKPKSQSWCSRFLNKNPTWVTSPSFRDKLSPKSTNSSRTSLSSIHSNQRWMPSSKIRFLLPRKETSSTPNSQLEWNNLSNNWKKRTKTLFKWTMKLNPELRYWTRNIRKK